MAYLKNTDTNEIITKYVSFNKTQDVNLTVQTALDGTEYLTRFGSPVYSYAIEAHVNETGKQKLMEAFSSLNLMQVRVRAGTFNGRIKSLSEFSLEYYGWYKVDVVLSAVSEVTDR